MPRKSLALTWAISTISGYGMYGLHLALEYLRGNEGSFIATRAPAQTTLPTLTQVRLGPVLALAKKIDDALSQNPSEVLAFDHPVLYVVGNECAGFAGQDRIRGTLNVGCAAIEHKGFSQSACDYARNYDMFIAISRWNEQYLKGLNVAPVHLCHQGIDTSQFMPGPKTGLWKDRFIIFSGGKFEFRKGQDITATAFKRFHARHPEALLITCWQNLLVQDPRPFAMAGHCEVPPQLDPKQGLQVTAWLRAQGLPEGSFIDLPYVPNMLMPAILRECDAALFPSRCEGGTNLVAMEAAACGVPTVVANNTGQKDLVDFLGFSCFEEQKPVKAPPDHASVEDWGETDPDALVEALEKIYTQRQAAQTQANLIAEKIKAWDWSPQNAKLLKIVCE